MAAPTLPKAAGRPTLPSLGVPGRVTSLFLSVSGAVTGAALCLSAGQGYLIGNARASAQLAREDGRYEQATQELQLALRFAPHAWQGWTDLAMTARAAWVFQQRPEQLALAESAYARAAQLNPRSAAPHAELARTLLVSGQAPASLDEYRRALARDPNSPGLRVAFAQALEAAGRPVQALEQYRVAARIDANEYSQDAERRLAPPAGQP